MTETLHNKLICAAGCCTIHDPTYHQGVFLTGREAVTWKFSGHFLHSGLANFPCTGFTGNAMSSTSFRCMSWKEAGCSTKAPSASMFGCGTTGGRPGITGFW